MKSKCVLYYVEGDDEKRLLEVLKTNMELIRPGKIQRLNAVEEEITDLRLRTLSMGTMVVLVFDTDTGSVDILRKNIKRLEKCPSISEVVLIPQVPNLEGELVRSCNIRKIEELLNSKSKREFKGDLLRVSNLDKKLEEHQFDIQIFWATKPKTPYQDIDNQSDRIKAKR